MGAEDSLGFQTEMELRVAVELNWVNPLVRRLLKTRQRRNFSRNLIRRLGPISLFATRTLLDDISEILTSRFPRGIHVKTLSLELNVGIRQRHHAIGVLM